jgi:pyruvate/2-oxoglutarate dehydrogenase complex dihydrolipoamide dehydrogenase (E3) component
MSMALIERHLFGGAFVNTGCILTKTLVAGPCAAHLARRGADCGVMHDAALRIDMVRVKACAVAVSANARAGVERWLRGMEGWSSTVTLLFGTGYRPRRRSDAEGPTTRSIAPRRPSTIRITSPS